MKLKRLILTSMTLVRCVAVVSAHQPYESSAVARLGREGVELTVTTSVEIAGRLVGEPMIGAAALENLRPQLLESAGGLYELSVGGKRLQPERVFFSLKTGEAVFSVIYPTATATEFGFRAAYLDRLPPGYAGSIEVLDESGRVLGRNPLLKRGELKDEFSVQMGSPASNPASAPHRQEAAPPWMTAASPPAVVRKQPGRQLPVVTSICAILLLGAGTMWRFQKDRK